MVAIGDSMEDLEVIENVGLSSDGERACRGKTSGRLDYTFK